MGSKVFGVTFTSDKQLDEVISILTKWKNQKATKIPLKFFDWSKENHYAIEKYDNNIYAIYNTRLSESCLSEHTLWEERMKHLQCDWLISFIDCSFSSYHAYSLYKHGKFIRSAHQQIDEPTTFIGEQQDFEIPLLNADFYYEDEDGNNI